MLLYARYHNLHLVASSSLVLAIYLSQKIFPAKRVNWINLLSADPNLYEQSSPPEQQTLHGFLEPNFYFSWNDKGLQKR